MKHTTSITKTLIALAALMVLCISSPLFAQTHTATLKLRGYIEPKATFTTTDNGMLDVQANHDGFFMNVTDELGNHVQLNDGFVASQGGNMKLNVVAI